MGIEQALENLNGRFHWIWQHDLEADVGRARKGTAELLQGLQV